MTTLCMQLNRALLFVIILLLLILLCTHQPGQPGDRDTTST